MLVFQSLPSLQNLYISLFSLIIFIVFIRLKWVSLHSKTKKRLPPSPQKLPIIGNLHQLGSSPHRSVHAMSQKHGPLMLLHLGSIPTLIASSVEAAQEIYKTHEVSFSNRPNLNMVNILDYGCRDIGFAPYGEHWRQLKSIIVSHLLNNKHVKIFQQVRDEETRHTISVLAQSCDSVVDLSATLVSLTNNIICKVAFRRTYPGSKYTDLLRKRVDMMGAFSVGNYIPWLSWVDRLSGLVGRAKKVAKDLDDFFEFVIGEHEDAQIGLGVKSHEEQDLVDILLDFRCDASDDLKLHRDTIKSVLLIVYAGGIDSLYTILDWIFSELIRHPRVMKKLQHEVTKIAQGRSIIPHEDLGKLQYLKAVIKETFRLHPPSPLLIPRISTQDVKLMGYATPANTQVLVSAWAIGRDPTLWDGPEEFRPERFLDSSIEYNGLHFELIPFGSGRRGCPGIQFSSAVMEFTLANMVHKFNFMLPNGVKSEDLDMSDIYGHTTHRKSSLMVMVSPRF